MALTDNRGKIGFMRIISKLIVSLIALTTSFSEAHAVQAAGAKLTIVLDGIPRQKGQVCLRIYNKASGFPESAAGVVQSGCKQVTGNSVTAQFYGLKPGTYAVAVYHDENSDRKLNTNFLGIPKEGFGISNNPPVKASAPKFKNASFQVIKDTMVRITMRYL